jgi:hypothetical protein
VLPRAAAAAGVMTGGWFSLFLLFHFSEGTQGKMCFLCFLHKKIKFLVKIFGGVRENA